MKNFLKYFFLFSFFMVCISSFFSVSGQTRDSLLNIYNDQTIRTSGNLFFKGTRRLNFRDLNSEFTSPYTLPLYKRAKADVRATWLFSGAGIAALITSIVIRKKNNNAANVLSIAAIGLNLGAIHFRRRSSEILDQAIWQRNKEILFNVTY